MAKKERYSKPTSMRARWGRLPPGVKSFALWASAAAAITSAIVGLNRAFPILEPYAPAHRLYVRDMVDTAEEKFKVTEDGNTYILEDIQIELAEGKRDAAVEARAKWADKLEDEKDPEKKAFYRDRVRESDLLVNRLENQLKTLNRAKAQKR